MIVFEDATDAYFLRHVRQKNPKIDHRKLPINITNGSGWSEEDQIYIGKCPDLITGIHGDDPIELYAELREAVQQATDHFFEQGRPFQNRKLAPCRKSSD